MPATGDPTSAAQASVQRIQSQPGDGLSVVADRLEVDARKAQIRSSVRGRRRQLDAQGAEAVDQAVARVLLGSSLLQGVTKVACYSALPGEPGTSALLAELDQAGVEVLLPVRRPDEELDWQLTGTAGAGAAPGSAAGGPQAIATVDLVIVPALAVDTAGRRLGQGGGSYDRALANVPARVPVVAVVHDEELLDAAVSPLPTLPHDRPVHAVATPTRWLWLAS